MNVYGYVAGNPLRFIDPNGQVFVPAVIGGVIGGISGYTGAVAGGAGPRSATAALAGITGAFVGSTPAVVRLAATGLGVSALSAATNMMGQVLSHEFERDDCLTPFNPVSVAGSVVGGYWAFRITRASAVAVSNAVIAWGPDTASNAIGTALGKDTCRCARR
jgi:hypothetical protein